MTTARFRRYICPGCGTPVKGWDDPSIAIECQEDDWHAPQYFHKNCYLLVLEGDADYQRALLKAYICARDAVARRTARMMLGQAESK